MPTPKPERKYNSTQAELYSICDIGWTSFEENLADFTAAKTFYDAAFLTARRGEVQAAKLLPDEQARGAVPESFNVQMQQAANAALLKWKFLRSHIGDAFTGDLTKPNVEAAGSAYYDTASTGNWEDLKAMLVAGQTFITENLGALTAAGMPAGFQLSYNNAMTAFTDLYDDFKDGEQDAGEGTDEKIIANNAIYDKMMKMFDDGQLIYDNNAAKRNRFIFAQVKSLVTPPGGGNGIPVTSLVIKGKVTDDSSGTGIVNAQVQVNDVADPANVQVTNTNATGDYFFKFDGMTAGAAVSIHHRVTAAGFVTEDKNINMTVGQTHKVNVAMLPEP